ncbi:hypothetical protein CLOM_g3706 [Closterium sp. NIES-68]|nr:hypothetical protein CLOM_g3706 [Closterium sp. NIES-68]GJP65995.1 hypothetical protein CLOP_g22883 [Closterium sp. NIES-67]
MPRPQILLLLLLLLFPLVTITVVASSASLVSLFEVRSGSSTQDRATILSESSDGVPVARRRLDGVAESVEPGVGGNVAGRAALFVDDGMLVGGAAKSATVGAAILSGASTEGEGSSLLPLDSDLVTDVSPVAKQQLLQRQQKGASRRGNLKERTSCSMERGSWQVDATWPLYESGTCPFVYHNQNCVKHGRPDRFFERLRWATPGCPLPSLSRDTLCSLVAGKSMAFVGDSIVRNAFESLACLMHGFYGMPENLPGLQMTDSRKLERGAVWATCNFTLAFYRTSFMVNLTLDDSTKPNGGGELDLGEPETGWLSRLDQHDVFVLNTGHWWSEHKIHSAGFRFAPPNQALPLTEGFQKAWEMALNLFKSDHMRGKVLVIATNPAPHFTGQGFKSGCTDTAPMSATEFLDYKGRGNCMKMEVLNGVMRRLVLRMHAREVAEGRVRGAQVVLLDQARPSLFRGDGHPGKWALLPNGVRDCGHFCLPGVPDAWNEMMLQRLWVLEEARQE